MTYQAEVLADSPRVYYRLGEASGTTVADSSGNGRNGTYSGAYTLGVVGLLVGDADTCVDFANGQARTTYAAWMDSTTATVEAIINLDSTAGIQQIVERDNQGVGGGGRAFQFRINGGKIEFIAFTSGGIQGAASATTLAPATTYHVAATYDGTNIRIYINGVLDNTTAISGTLNSAAQDLLIGRSSYSATNPLDGRIDEVSYYGTALSGTRIAAHYTAAITTSGGGGTVSLSLAGTLPAIQSSLTLASYTDTVTDNDWQGRVRAGSFQDESEEPVEPLPAGLTRAVRVDKALAYPTPTMVAGRPT